jgi:hypothetical protein
MQSLILFTTLPVMRNDAMDMRTECTTEQENEMSDETRSGEIIHIPYCFRIYTTSPSKYYTLVVVVTTYLIDVKRLALIDCQNLGSQFIL